MWWFCFNVLGFLVRICKANLRYGNSQPGEWFWNIYILKYHHYPECLKNTCIKGILGMYHRYVLPKSCNDWNQKARSRSGFLSSFKATAGFDLFFVFWRKKLTGSIDDLSLLYTEINWKWVSLKNLAQIWYPWTSSTIAMFTSSARAYSIITWNVSIHRINSPKLIFSNEWGRGLISPKARATGHRLWGDKTKSRSFMDRSIEAAVAWDHYPLEV